MRIRRLEHDLRQRASGTIGGATEACRQDDGGLCAFGTQFGNESGYRIGWRTDHCKLRDDVQAAHIRVAGITFHAVVLRIDQTQRPPESTLEQISSDRRTNAAVSPARADDRDGLGREQVLQIPGSHGRRYYNGVVSSVTPTRMNRREFESV